MSEASGRHGSHTENSSHGAPASSSPRSDGQSDLAPVVPVIPMSERTGDSDGKAPLEAAPDRLRGLDTGDLVLFNRKCTSMGLTGALLCTSAKLINGTRWDHIGLVVRGSDADFEEASQGRESGRILGSSSHDPSVSPSSFPALETRAQTSVSSSAEQNKLYLLEANFGGVKLRPLDERIAHSHSHEVVVRKLIVKRTPKMRQAVKELISDIRHTPYDSGWRRLLNASLTTSTQKIHQVPRVCTVCTYTCQDAHLVILLHLAGGMFRSCTINWKRSSRRSNKSKRS